MNDKSIRAGGVIQSYQSLLYPEKNREAPSFASKPVSQDREKSSFVGAEASAPRAPSERMPAYQIHGVFRRWS